MKKYIFVIFSFSFLFVTSLSFAQWENPPIALPASDGASSDEYGFSVDLSEDVGIVGAPYHDHLGSNSGAAYVWRKTGDQWVFEQELLASDGAAGDEFGYAVSISGDFAVVGAWNSSPYGAAYVYRYSGASWIQDQKLVSSDPQSGDWFGQAVAISGHVIFVCAVLHDNPAGAVYVYRYNGQSWIQEQKITPPSGFNPGPYFGNSVAVWNDVAVIGNKTRTTGGVYGIGAAYVYRYDGSIWNIEGMLLPEDWQDDHQFFSHSLDIYDDVIIAGVPGADAGNIINAGSVYVFRYDGGNWNLEQKLLASDGNGGDSFSSAVSVYENLIAIGAPNRSIYDPFWLVSYGVVYVFRNDSGYWIEEFILVLDVGSQGWSWDDTGNSVSIYENHILVGSHLNDVNAITDSGNAFIFEGEPIPTECTGDIDGNNIVDIQDFLALLAAWGPNPGHAADFNQDGVVDIQDFLDLLAQWGPCP